MKYLYQFYWDCGRMGELDGLFVATEKEVANAIGKEAYFGEVLGKHSEVYGTIEEREIEKLDVSPEAVKEVCKHLGHTWSGFNPLHYIQIECEECQERMGVDEWDCEYREEFDSVLCSNCMKKLEEEGQE
jgi:hypothetical protein